MPPAVERMDEENREEGEKRRKSKRRKSRLKRKGTKRNMTDGDGGGGGWRERARARRRASIARQASQQDGGLISEEALADIEAEAAKAKEASAAARAKFKVKKAAKKMALVASLAGGGDETHDGAWEKKHDPQSGRDYWVNSATGKSSWSDPSTAPAKGRKKKGKRKSVRKRQSSRPEKLRRSHTFRIAPASDELDDARDARAESGYDPKSELGLRADRKFRRALGKIKAMHAFGGKGLAARAQHRMRGAAGNANLATETAPAPRRSFIRESTGQEEDVIDDDIL